MDEQERKRDTLKARVDVVGRKDVAKAAGMPYTTLSHKLGGFLPLPPEDILTIEGAIESTIVKLEAEDNDR